MSSDSHKVIFIDDDIDILEIATVFLTGYGFTVYPFTNGLDAIEKFLEEPVDVVLTDLKMPFVSGLEVLQKIRAVDQETPVILMTGHADATLAGEAMRLGAFDFINKPYQFPYLLRLIEKGARHKKASRQQGNPAAQAVSR